jgi:phage terminase large subunit-like protein
MPPEIDHRPWIRTKADQRAYDEGMRVVPAHGDRVGEFFARFLRHSKGPHAGQRFALLPWQSDGLLYPLYSWRRPDGSRRFRKVYCEVPKKNGKSTIASGVGLYETCGVGEAGPEVYSAANDRDQAAIVFREAAAMVRSSPALLKRLRILTSIKKIEFPAANGFYKAMSSEANTKEGVNASAIICDELHAWDGWELWDTLKYAGAARVNPLMFIITTAGTDSSSVCWEEHEKAEAIISGESDDVETLAMIYTVPKGWDWREERSWAAANPSYGVTVRIDQMKKAVEDARRYPSEENKCKRYRLNIWTSTDVRYLSSEDWDACGDPGVAAWDKLKGLECFGGIDLSSTTDVTGFSLYFPTVNALLVRFWVPDKAPIGREATTQRRLREWARQGFATVAGERSVDYSSVLETMAAANRDFELVDVGIDRWNCDEVVNGAIALGIKMVGFGQGFRDMSPPCKQIERDLVDRRLKHEANKILGWMVGNVKMIGDDAGNIKPTKQRSKGKIDGFVAAVMARGGAMRQAAKDALRNKPSVYSTRGVMRYPT